ncbi:MAG TPA: rhomboid family intramembrane serine protease [Gemmatimonadaceae bacterium]|nr:rhomboid family intramembrane serine protease [Gemmatimonadaceae bacterium]
MTPWVKRLIAANAIVFFLQLTVPGITSAFAFVPALILLRPWTVITYMFVHGGWMHILFNLIVLFFFGPRVESRLGSRRFLALYFLSGISGAALSFVLAPASAIIGASAAIFGVEAAFAKYWPRELIYIWGVLPIQAVWLIALTVAYSVWSGMHGSTGGVADFAHLGGIAGGFLYLWWLDRHHGARSFKARATAAPRVAHARVLDFRRVDTSSLHELNRDEVNRILDKISAHGVDSLTPEERVFLSNFVPPDDRVPPVS